MLRDGEIWRPLPDEGYRPEILWAGVGGEKNKPSERGAMRWRAGKALYMAITTTCVTCLEHDNDCMVYVSYMVACMGKTAVNRLMNRPKVTFLVSSAFEILSYNWRKACAVEKL